jgi:hypothetical protein
VSSNPTSMSSPRTAKNSAIRQPEQSPSGLCCVKFIRSRNMLRVRAKDEDRYALHSGLDGGGKSTHACVGRRCRKGYGRYSHAGLKPARSGAGGTHGVRSRFRHPEGPVLDSAQEIGCHSFFGKPLPAGLGAGTGSWKILMDGNESIFNE